MIRPPERSTERDAAIDAVLPFVPTAGWSTRALLAAGLGDDAYLLFPGGATDMVEAYCDLADRRMVAGAASIPGLDAMRLPSRVRAIIALRFEQCRPDREAVRRALAVLAASGRAGLATICTARTVDAIWDAADDRSADFSWYTKRAILAGVYGSTLLFWLADGSGDDTATLAFLDRRLAGVGRIGKARRRVDAALEKIVPARLREVD